MILWIIIYNAWTVSYTHLDVYKRQTVTTFNKYGVPCRYVDEDLKAEVQMKYLIELSKCEVR